MGGSTTGLTLETDDTLTMTDGTLSVTNPTHSAVLTQEEYDALPEEQKKGIYIVDDGEEDGSDDASSESSAGEVYSTEETRIGTWIDGKPLYQKVINIVMPSITDAVDVKTSLVSTEIDTLVFFNCHIISTVYNVINVPYSTKKPKNNPTDADEDISTNVFINTSDGFLYVYNTIPGLVSRPGLAIVKYTKTTDGGDS